MQILRSVSDGNHAREFFTPRDYQLELLDCAVDHNSVVSLGTGFGKTYIGILLLKEFQYRLFNDKMKAFFVCDKVALVLQQEKQLLSHTSLNIGVLHGQIPSNFWTEKDKFDEFFAENEVIVLTAEILNELLRTAYVKMSQIALLIVDECHHVAGQNHPYRVLMNTYRETNGTRPRILGLTASVVSGDPNAELIEEMITKIETLMCSKLETANAVTTLARYGPRPSEYILTYHSAPLAPSYCQLKDAETQVRFFDLSADVGDVLNIISEGTRKALSALETLGPFCCARFCRAYSDHIKATIKLDEAPTNARVASTERKILFSFAQTIFQQCTAHLKPISHLAEQSIPLQQYVTPIVFRVLETLKAYNDHLESGQVEKFQAPETSQTEKLSFEVSAKSGGNESANEPKHAEDAKPLSALVFILERQHASLLSLFLQELAKYRPDDFGFIRASFIVGRQGLGVSHTELMNESQLQEERLRKFRQNKLNVLVTTSVLEEGIDVKTCNCVIRMNRPEDYRAYIQSRGRARARNAVYCLLTEESRAVELRQKIHRFNIVEELLISRFPTTNEEISAIDMEEVEEIVRKRYVVEKTGASVDLQSAVSLINRYCAKLPSDVFTRLAPDVRVMPQQFGHMIQYKAQLLLPINAPFKSPICLETPVSSSSLARRAVALKTCELLHAKKELTDHLLPAGKDAISTIGQAFSETNAELGLDEKTSRLFRTRRLYDRKVSKTVVESLPAVGKECFVYIIDIHLVAPLTDEENPKNRKIVDPRSDSHAFALLTTCDLPAITKFPVFLRQGKSEISLIRCAKTLNLDQPTMDRIQSLHRHIVEDILHVKGETLFAPENSTIQLLIAPIIKKIDAAGRISDYELDTAALSADVNHQITRPPEEERKNYKFDPSKFVDAVVTPWYRPTEHPTYFYVADINESETPAMKFPDEKFSSFNDYFKAKYDLQIYDQSQRLLDVDRASERMNLILPRVKTKSRQSASQQQLLVPELVYIHPLPSIYWTMIIALPTILYRLNQFLLIDELRSRIMREAFNLSNPKTDDGFEWPALDYDIPVAKREESRQPKAASDNAAKNMEISTSEKEENESSLDIGVWDPRDGAEFQRPRGPVLDGDPMSADTRHCSSSVGASTIIREDDDLEMSDGELEEQYVFSTDFNVELRRRLGEKDLFAPLEPAATSTTGWGVDFENGGMSAPPPSMEIGGGLVSLVATGEINTADLMSDIQRQQDTDLEAEPKSNGTSAGERRKPTPEESSEKEIKENKRKETESRTSSPENGTKKTEKTIRVDEEDVIDVTKFNSVAKDLPLPVNNEIKTVAPEKAGEFEQSTSEVDKYDALVNGTPQITAPPITLSYRFQTDFTTDYPYGVPPALLLQALTTASASDGMNLERLETVGDSFLKLAVTLFLYTENPLKHEGKLSFARSKVVSNENLFKLGCIIGLPSIMEAAKFDPNVSWLPPSYVPLGNFHVAAQHMNMGAPNAVDLLKNDEDHFGEGDAESTNGDAANTSNSTAPKNKTGWDEGDEDPVVEENGVQSIWLSKPLTRPDEKLDIIHNSLTQQWINDKAIADCVEALIGAHLVTMGMWPTLKLMHFLKLNVIVEPRKARSPLQAFDDEDQNPEQMRIALQTLHNFYIKYQFAKLEEKVKYSFGNKAFLVQAFTHASFHKGRVTGCYQRLEFLGDAVLDYLITRFLYEHPRRLNPGDLTDFRSALVNNTIFASLAVKNDLHKYFLSMSSPLAQKIEKFAAVCDANGFCPNFDVQLLMTEDEADTEENVEVPKAMGDIFESLAGAIYLDCGMDLDVVWRVYYAMMKDVIDVCFRSEPKSPVRELFEKYNARFSKLERIIETNKIRVTVEVENRGECEPMRFVGMGRSFRLAKSAAAKEALKYMMQLESQRSGKK